MPRNPLPRRVLTGAAPLPQGTSSLGGRQLSVPLTLAHLDALTSLAVFCQLDGTQYAAAAVRAIGEKLSAELHGSPQSWTIAYAATVALNLKRHRSYMAEHTGRLCDEVVDAIASVQSARLVDPAALGVGRWRETPVPFKASAPRRAQRDD